MKPLMNMPRQFTPKRRINTLNQNGIPGNGRHLNAFKTLYRQMIFEQGHYKPFVITHYILQ